MKARLLPPPRVDSPAPPTDQAEAALLAVHRAREEVAEADAALALAEAENIEAYAVYEHARDRAQAAIDAEAGANDRLLRALEAMTAATARLHEFGSLRIHCVSRDHPGMWDGELIKRLQTRFDAVRKDDDA